MNSFSKLNNLQEVKKYKKNPANYLQKFSGEL